MSVPRKPKVSAPSHQETPRVVPEWLRFRARTRLLLAFTVLAGLTLTLAVVGWLGLSNTERALLAFEQRALPEVSRSLELAERTANLAAVAPYVASASSPFMLRGLARTLEEKIARVLDLAEGLPQLDAAAPALPVLLQRLESTVNELIRLTREQLFLREDLRQYDYRLRSLLGRVERQAPAGGSGNQPVVQLVEWLLGVSHTSSREALAMAQQRYQTLLTELRRTATAGDVKQPAMADWLDELYSMGSTSPSLFEMRHRQFELQQRSTFLLASTRAISEQLSGEVKRFVDQVENRIAHESRRMGRSVSSGQTGILAIALLCLVAAVGGAWVVRGLALNLGAVTGMMSRLAAGDTHQQMPAVERQDEIGELARAFQVFRNNALQIDRIRQDLEKQTRLLETVFNNINDGLSVFDRQGRLIAWNPQYLSILELPAERLHRGMTIDQVHGLLSREAQESWALDGMALDKDQVNQLRQLQVQRFERHFANGRVVEFRSSPMPGGGFVTLYSDLTERKTIEAQLRQSQKMEVLGQLTGGVAHDFNNLLAALFGNLQLLEEQLPREGKARLYAERAMAAAERGRSLTQRLLAFSRKQHLQPEIIDVDELIEGMLDLIEYSVGADIAIQLDLQGGSWVTSVDPGQLENALLNLAINSSAAMPEGGTLTLSTHRESQMELNGERRDVLQVRVADTGCGIAEAHLRRVFEPFFTTKAIGEGSGLGLSMVYGFVKQSGGDIRVSSVPDAGTTIEIFLPRAVSEVSVPAAGAKAESGDTPQGHGQRVLMVEDDRAVLMAGVALLERLNYQVDAVASAEEALAHLERGERYALVFSDINLGAGGSGLQLASALETRWPELPVLLTSGLSARQLSSRYGIEDTRPILPKPYRREELAAAVSAALGPDKRG